MKKKPSKNSSSEGRNSSKSSSLKTKDDVFCKCYRITVNFTEMTYKQEEED